MSQYLTFLMRKGDNLIPLCDYRSSSVFYKIAFPVTADGVAALVTKEDLDNCAQDVCDDIRFAETTLLRLKDKRKELTRWTGVDVHERMELLDEIQCEEESANDRILNLRSCLGMIDFLRQVVDDSEYYKTGLYAAIDWTADMPLVEIEN